MIAGVDADRGASADAARSGSGVSARSGSGVSARLSGEAEAAVTDEDRGRRRPRCHPCIADVGRIEFAVSRDGTFQVGCAVLARKHSRFVNDPGRTAEREGAGRTADAAPARLTGTNYFPGACGAVDPFGFFGAVFSPGSRLIVIVVACSVVPVGCPTTVTKVPPLMISNFANCPL